MDRVLVFIWTLQARKDAAEAAKPTVNTPEQAKEIERQALEKNPVTKLSPEQAKAIDEQSKPTVNTQEQAKAINDAAIERYKPHDPENVNKNEVEIPGESDILKLEASSPFKNSETPLLIDSNMQSKHIKGGKRYNDYVRAHDYEPSILTISEEKASEFVEKYHGTGILKLNSKGEIL